MHDAGDLRVGTVVVNTTDMERALAFWEAALGYRRRESDTGSDLRRLSDPSGRRLPIYLQQADAVPSGAPPVHLDLFTAEQSAQVDRLVSLGATVAEDWRTPPGAEFVVLRDPDGNAFCVVDQQGG